ncbi:DNA recombination protein RmuC, partial [Patescibacteria group bacterium]|nr:DNA recombination protein RmuC [Patescibacteria group bacterium]
IDSKFSLENYNKIVEENDSTQRGQLEKAFKNDLKNRIDETAKYIRPNEGTIDFAFMFIPAEGIFYDLLVNKVGAIKVNTRDLIDYAINEKKVHIVSPTTFYVTLQSLWQGMRAFQVQEKTKEILKQVGNLDTHIKAYEDYLKKLGGHLGTTVNMYNSAYKEFKKIDKDVVKLTDGESTVDPIAIDKPKTE